MNRLERIERRCDCAEAMGCEAEISTEDLRALLTAVLAAVVMPEPYLTYGPHQPCVVCGVDLVQGDHLDSCCWQRTIAAINPLLEEVNG